jgi:hypothetical protein
MFHVEQFKLNIMKKLLQYFLAKQTMIQEDQNDYRYNVTIFRSKVVNFKSIIVSDKIKKIRTQIDFNNPSSNDDINKLIAKLKTFIIQNF